MAMSTPSWLYYLFGVLMLAVAAYCFTLLVLSRGNPPTRWAATSRSPTSSWGWPWPACSSGHWAFGRSAVWEIIFGALLVWFLVESIQSVRPYGLHLPHALIHAVMNFAMLLMYWFPMGSSARVDVDVGVGDGSRSSIRGSAFVVAFILFASAIFTLASPNKGASHFGSHAPAYAMAGCAGQDRPTVPTEGGVRSRGCPRRNRCHSVAGGSSATS